MARGASHWGIGFGAAVLSALPISAQAQTASGTTASGTAAPADQTPQPKPTLTPQQIIKAIGTLVQKRPAPIPTPTATATPPPPPVPPPSPSSPPSPSPAASQSGAGTAKPPIPPAAIRPAPAVIRPVPSAPAPPPSDDAVVLPPTPEPVVPSVSPEPWPAETQNAAPPQPAEAPQPPEPEAPFWPWLTALAATVAGAGYGLRRWFWPKLALSCEIAVGPDTLGPASRPLLESPEVNFDVRIEVGEASAPAGSGILGEAW